MNLCCMGFKTHKTRLTSPFTVDTPSVFPKQRFASWDDGSVVYMWKINPYAKFMNVQVMVNWFDFIPD